MDAHVKLLAPILILVSASLTAAQDDSSLTPNGSLDVTSEASLAREELRVASVAPNQTSAKEFEAAKIVARVGDQVVLAGDLFGQINQFLHDRLKEVPEAQRALLTPEVLAERRWDLMKQLLPQMIDGKLIYLDFLRSIPADRLPDIQDSLYQAFDEQRLPQLIEKAKVETAADLDGLLRSFGSSLGQQRRTFAEQLAAMQWQQRNATSNKEVSHDDLVKYYQEHIDDYQIRAKCRWEQLSAHDSETFTRSASRKLIAEMGNEVFRGAAFAAVAKKSSHGFTSEDGGAFDWTNKDSLRSEPINESLFTLPVGYLSKIIEDDMGCHIIRVIERQEESVVPFAEVQGSIRKKIREGRSKAAMEDYVASLRDEFPVWTIFDDQP